MATQREETKLQSNDEDIELMKISEGRSSNLLINMKDSEADVTSYINKSFYAIATVHCATSIICVAE